MIIFELTLK